jgi:hypothetical protein
MFFSSKSITLIFGPSLENPFILLKIVTLVLFWIFENKNEKGKKGGPYLSFGPW